MNKSCKHCNHIHAGDDARAIGRFAPGGPIGYKAKYEGSPLRTTRKQAKQDMCQWRQNQKCLENQIHTTPLKKTIQEEK